MLWVAADKYLPTDDVSIPLGKAATVKGTVMDFTTPHVIGERIETLKKPPHTTLGLRPLLRAARAGGARSPWRPAVEDPTAAGPWKLLTTEPGVQVDCGNFLIGDVASGGFQSARGALPRDPAFSRFAESPDFPTTVLRPGQTYRQTTVHRFGVK